MPAAAAGTRQEHALRTLRKAVQLHSARRAGSAAPTSGTHAPGTMPAVMPAATAANGLAADVPSAAGMMGSQQFGLRDSRSSLQNAGLNTWNNSGVSRHIGIAGVASGPSGSQSSQQPAMSQQPQFFCSQGDRQSQPTADTTLPANELFASQQKKIGLNADQWSATLSTQTPSNLGPSDNVEMSQASQWHPLSQPMPKTPTLSQPMPRTPALSQPLLPQAGTQASQGMSQSVLAPQPSQVSAPAPEAAQHSSNSNGVAAAAAALVSALAGLTAAPAAAGQSAPSAAAFNAGVTGRSEERRHAEEDHRDERSRLARRSASKPVRRRLRGKGPHRLPTPSPPPRRHEEPQTSPRRWQSAQRGSPGSPGSPGSASSARSSGTPQLRATRRTRARSVGHREERRQPNDDRSLLDRALADAGTHALAGLEQCIGRANQDHATQLRSVRQDVDEVLTLLSEYRKRCADHDALIAEISTVVEEATSSVNECLRRGCRGAPVQAALGRLMGRHAIESRAIADRCLGGSAPGGSDSLPVTAESGAGKPESLGLLGFVANAKRQRLTDGVVTAPKRRRLAA